jgi:hypothetical protein
VNILRRLPLSRLLLLCSVVVAVGVGATALALAVGTGPTPPPKPLADALHDALAAPRVSGVSARIQLTDHLLEGASLASNGGEASRLSSSPLISGASGRLWIGAEGRARLELQSEKGDTQVLWDGKTASLYDASTNTLYRYTPQAGYGGDLQSAGSGTRAARAPRAQTRAREGFQAPRKSKKASPRPARTPISRARHRPTSQGKPPTPCASHPAKMGA